ncbi:hypothetical protein SteCoe_31064 [Stentor coeruleus]|uniref:Protein kinase domain-containing protein n=1 Tax=Stentor coeruleus TaxID=5963 RepID=A0A1R2B2A6_9CILI|nr:hypothetical protein SteCoe_31064 [Stentor coeruleus]
MSAKDKSYLEELRRNFRNITITDTEVIISYTFSEENIPLNQRAIFISIDFSFINSIRLIITQQVKILLELPRMQILEKLQQTNSHLDYGFLKYDLKNNYIYFSNYLNIEKYSPQQILPSFINMIKLSIKTYEDLILKSNFYSSNTLDEWLGKRKRKQSIDTFSNENRKSESDISNEDDNGSSESSDIEDEIEDPIMDFTSFSNDSTAIKMFKSIPKVWEMCDYENLDENVLVYMYNPLESMTHRLKSYKITIEYIQDAIKFLMILKSADIEFLHLPINYFMASINQKNEICNFKFALNFNKPLNKDKRFAKKKSLRELDKYKIYLKEALTKAIAKSLDECYTSCYYAESKLTIENFEIKKFNEMKLLGEGGFGKVYLNNYNNRQVAVKRPNIDKESEEQTNTRILRELNILKLFTNKYIIKAYGVVEIEKQLCLVIEYCNGNSLKQNLEILSPSEKLGIMKKVALALTVMHDKKIIHCDIKPSNILLHKDKYQIPKIIDFGLAVINDEVIKNVGFTKEYADPDQLASRIIDPATDVWSYGMTYFHVLEGNSPFHRLQKDSGEKLDIYKMLSKDDIRPIFSENTKKYHADELRIIECCWKKKREKRIQLREVLNLIQNIEKKKKNNK